MSSIRSRADSVFYDSDFSENDFEGEDDNSLRNQQLTRNDSITSDEDDSNTLNRRNSTYSTWSDSTNSSANSSYLSASQRALGTLQTLHSNPASSWKRALKHKSGTVVFVTKEKLYVGQKNPGTGGAKGSSEGFYAPVFKGELILDKFSPPEVFKIVGTRSLWDEWYKEGYLLENLSDTASLTYMCMKGIAGTSTRDLCLVEQVSATEKGEILFVSTSVNSPKVPRVDGRIRASIALNGWVLEPLPNGQAGTKITYYLHVNVKTFLPSFAAVKYLARRPTCIAKIAEYLNSHGLSEPLASVEALPTRDSSLKSVSPSTTLVTTTNSSNERTHTNSGTMNNDSPSVVVNDGTRSKSGRKDSTASKRSVKSTASSIGSALPFHVHPNEETTSYLDIQRAQHVFKGFLSIQGGEWTTIKGDKGVAIFLKEASGNGLGVVKGERRITGVTTEQVLGTLLSEGARKEWDLRFLSTSLINLDNGFDQDTHIEFHKAIYPSFNARHYIVSRGVDRDDTTSDNGSILLVSRSTKATTSITIPKDSTRGQLEVSGWYIDSANSSPDASLHLTHIVSVDPRSSTPLQPVVSKILTSEIAKAPHLVAEFIDSYGFAPYFLRWGEGPAEFLGEVEKGTKLKEGKVVFRIGGGGDGTMKNGEQKAWLNYSEKMFERGLDITLEPRNAAVISKVDGLSKTVEFIWNDSIKQRGGATITLRRAENGDGPEDLYIDGEFLDKTVGMEKRRASIAGGGSMRKKVIKKDSKEGATSSTGNGIIVNGNSSRGESVLKDATGNPTIASAGSTLASTARSVVAPLLPASLPQQPQQSRSVNFQEHRQEGQQQDVAQKFNFPEDAVLIISKDLYFTAPQVKLVLGIVLLAWLWGKFA